MATNARNNGHAYARSTIVETSTAVFYDRPFHCSLCKRRFRRRFLVEFWDEGWSAKELKRSYRKWVVRLCVADPATKNIGAQAGCVEAGLAALFKEAKQNTRAVLGSERAEERRRAQDKEEA